MPVDYPNFCIQRGSSLFELLSCKFRYFDETAAYSGKYCMNQAFRTAGSLFQVFENDALDVIVPYGGGAELIAELTGTSHPDPSFLSQWLRCARPYAVAVYDWQLERLGNAVTEHSGMGHKIFVQSEDRCDDGFGSLSERVRRNVSRWDSKTVTI